MSKGELEALLGQCTQLPVRPPGALALYSLHTHSLEFKPCTGAR